jgi:hypothetical protein
MNELKLTEAEAAAVLSGAARREAEEERMIGQAELLAIAREAGLSEESIMAELAGHAGAAAAKPAKGPIEQIQHVLPLEPWEAVAAISERAKRVVVRGTGPALVVSAKLKSGTMRVSLEPGSDGCLIRPNSDLGIWRIVRTATIVGSITFWVVVVLVIASTFRPGVAMPVALAMAAWTGLATLSTLGWLSLLGWVQRERKVRARAVLAGLIEELGQPGAQAESLACRRD